MRLSPYRKIQCNWVLTGRRQLGQVCLYLIQVDMHYWWKICLVLHLNMIASFPTTNSYMQIVQTASEFAIICDVTLTICGNLVSYISCSGPGLLNNALNLQVSSSRQPFQHYPSKNITIITGERTTSIAKKIINIWTANSINSSTYNKTISRALVYVTVHKI